MSKGKSSQKPWYLRFLFFAFIALLLIAGVVTIIYLTRGWISDTINGIVRTFGWGLVITALAVLTILVIAYTRPVLFLRYWNRLIGFFILLAAVWGVLSFIEGSGRLLGHSLGGEIGKSITVGPSAIGVFIVVLLFIAGLFFAWPRGFAHLLMAASSWLFRRSRVTPAESASVPLPEAQTGVRAGSHSSAAGSDLKTTAYPLYSAPPKPKSSYPVNGSKSWLWNRLHPQPAAPTDAIKSPTVATDAQVTAPVSAQVMDQPLEAGVSPADLEALPEEGKKTAEDSAGAKGPAKDVKQLAQEVWKKYGETGALATADGWKLPPLEMLDNSPEVEFSQADNLKKAKLIEDALASYGVEGKVVQINVGPTVTQFGIEPGWDRKLKEIKEKDKSGDVRRKIEEVAKTRVKVDRITSLANDLSLALAAPSIRIEAPVPGKSVVGIEVPNSNIGVVSLRAVVESNVFQKSESKTKLTVALGKGAGGESIVGDLAKMPHLLIAGATGSGKTVCIHSLICCLLLYNTPGDVRFIMIDPKRVELTSYNSLPHLATPVIVDTNRALLALRGLSQEMDKRYQTLAAVRGARNIEAYNKMRPREKLPYLVLVIDELADLMMTSGEEVEHTLCRLAQLARAVGIHLIVATQRPSVDVVTGLIKANFPTRISFAVTSQVDSRTILDSGGAEKLLGRGDMLYMPTEAAKPKRLQGCFLSDAEIERIVYFWNNQKKEVANQLRMDDLLEEEEEREEKIPADPLLEEARKLAASHDTISASFLQRHLRIGYPRAARLMELLEADMGEDLKNHTDDGDGRDKPESGD
jgi:DNA segregation ATPase FtsK/SpoIIIE, S-DNA-T family